MPLTQEQFQKARAAGFSTDQIIGFESKREPRDRSKFETSEFQGGATSPANLQAQEDVKKAQFDTDILDVPIAPMAAANQFAGNIPRMLTGGKFPEATTTEGRFVSDVGGLVGGMVSPVYPAILKPLGNLAGKAINPIAKSFSDVMKYSKPQNQIKLADEVQNALMSQKRNVIDKYGKEYESIIGQSKSKVDLSPAIKNFIDESQSLMQNPEFAQQVAAKNPQAMKIFDMADKMARTNGLESISAKEADSLSKYIKNMPGLKSKLDQANKKGWHTVQWSNEDRMLLGLADDIKGSVIQSHPELQGLNTEYGQFMNSYKKVAPDFKIGSTISKLKDYGNYDPQKAQLLEGILPKETVSRIKDFSNAEVTSNVLKKLGLGAAGAAGMGTVGKAAWDLSGH